ncbi:toll-like receptor 4 [Mizuhopecten yessoensis]|uniref:Toll-like receptor 4 n=1 Tax=Mizuhopecten yessoensis TaxID=6573 RepID=A0A210QQ94_MIZYE|nr:toll-like receptor 4 [Mizuhopecten yessoensis]OWF50884.1 Toll-like receptor 4 [Mizuhopecten yessoensis]
MFDCASLFHWILFVSLPFYQLVVGEGTYNATRLSQILGTVNIQNNGRELDMSSNCSSEARCWCGESNDIQVADCSGLNLTAIPDFLSTVGIVDLRYNQLAVVNNTDQLPQNLLYLDLSNNRLANFTGNPFDHLAKLAYLDLSDNYLSYSPSIYTLDLFSCLTSLTFLNIKGNNERSGSDLLHYPDAISSLLGLTTLKMDGLKNARLGDVLSPLKKLATLDLSGRNGHCWIDHMTEDFFEGVVSSLVDIDLSTCKIVYIDNGTFRSLPNLTVLSLSGNNQLTFNVLINLTYDLQATNIHKLFLNKLHCTYGVGTFLFQEDLMLLNNTRLEELYLDFNRIELVEDTMMQYLPDSLKLLSVAGNKFTLGKYLLAMHFLDSLKYLDVSLQFSPHGSVGEMLEQCFDWRCPKETKNESQEPRSLKFYGKWRPSLYLPRNLEVIDGHSSSFRGEIGDFNFMERNIIKQFDLHDNLLQSWKGPIRNLHRVEYIDLSYNSCGHVTTHFFEDFPNMTTLNVSHNNLGEVFKNSATSDILKQLKSLEKLNMTHNKIDRLPEGVLRDLSALRQIDLSFNQLTDWNVKIDHMYQLQLLNISYNRLIVLSKSFMDAVDRMTKITNLTLDLRGNPLRCDCNKLDFLKWVSRRKSLFINIETYDCRITNETQISFGDLGNIIARLERDCSDYVGIIVGTLVVIVICVSVVIGGVGYRFRWKLRYLYYMAKNRYRGYVVVRDTLDSHYNYDAFISYSDSNSSFVIHDIVENLETNHGLRLCLHQRDFLPGNEIAVNITNAISNSRKTVAIITNSYLDSYWCMFEFNMARMESVYTRAEENVLFLILYEKLPRRQIPMDVLDVIESDSYIEYPDDEQGNVVFWDKIREAISG